VRAGIQVIIYIRFPPTPGFFGSRPARPPWPACSADACRPAHQRSTCRMLATWCSGTPATWGLEGIVSKRLDRVETVRSLGVQLHIVAASSEGDFASAFVSVSPPAG
jgi:hypothetical protein